MSRRTLRALAEQLGIISEYVDQTGQRIRRTSDATREALLSVMGFDAPTEDAAAAWLDELKHERRNTIIDSVRVVERDSRRVRDVRVTLPPGVRRAEVTLTLREESGHTWEVRRQLQRSGVIQLPTRPPYGYHRLEARVESADGAHTVEQSMIVVPSTCTPPRALLGDAKVMGVVANLYAVRREHDWGVGDLTTLTSLAEWAASRGADFVGVNPLHALWNRGWQISPYSPVSRLFRNAIYIDVDAVPELAHSEEARALLGAQRLRAHLRHLRETPLVDYDEVIALKERVLFLLYHASRRSSERRRAFEEFARKREPELTAYATWMVIAETSGQPDWRQWPEALRSADSDAARAFAAAHADRVDFHRWMQFEADRQLHDASQRARVSGMRIGVYQDLAIGTNPGGSDTWTFPDLFLEGAAVGAPPDPYSSLGQNWGLPPMSPRALRAQGYRYWIQLLRRAFDHAGALRIDHIMGLFRTFWIPDGHTGKDGAYVRFPAQDLLGILALESVRHDSLVVGEDLGTVPPDVPPALRKWGILSSKVLYFEREGAAFRPASRYPELALATANTHDMPTLAGFWKEDDVALRERVGLLRSAAEIRRARRDRAADKRALLTRLELTPPRHYEEPYFPRRLTGVVHDYLASTRAVLLGESFDDLLGEVEPVNVPGVGPDKYPSWRRKNRITMEEVSWSFEVDDAIRAAARRRKGA